VVALSLVAGGTSLPELVVSVRAALTDHRELILGNVVGSNTANILLIGGVAAVVRPLVMIDPSLRATSAAMVAVSLLFTVLALSGGVTPFEGGILLAGFAFAFGVMSRNVVKAQRGRDTTTPIDWVLGHPSKYPTIAVFIVIGIVALPVGADLLIDAAVQLAGRLGVSETVVGLTVVAIGTSLPELATSIVAAMQGRAAMAVATVIGSNTFNILGILGLSAAVGTEPIPVSTRFLSVDVTVMVASAVIMGALVWLKRPITRGIGIVFLAAYVAYVLGSYLNA
jgi:cation:H+ antiporter